MSNTLFLGGGNMATAMISGLIASKVPTAQLFVVDVSDEALARARALGCVAFSRLQDAPIAAMDTLVLATKPQTLHDALAPIAGVLGASQTALSICAGVRVAEISRWLGGHRNIVRAMPNTPALIGKGITGLYAAPSVSAAAKIAVENIIAATGAFSWFDNEKILDAVTAVSGSGPAYVFLFIESLMQAARELGFSEAQAREFAYATFSGAVELAHRSDEPVSVLRERVTSKGGTTAAALASMETDAVKVAIVRAVRAAEVRAAELGDMMAGGG